MFNKIKRAITYICKKIKPGVKIMAEVGTELVSAGKDIVNTVGCKAVDRIADHADKKLDMIQAAAVGLKSTGSSLCNGVKSTGSSLCNGVKSTGSSLCNCFYNANNRKVIGVIFAFVGMGLYASGYIRNDKEAK